MEVYTVRLDHIMTGMIPDGQMSRDCHNIVIADVESKDLRQRLHSLHHPRYVCS